MYDEAITWAGSRLGTTITGVAELAGGMTSTMLALTDHSGTDTVLRLMTNEPWRSHGAELVVRERAAQQALTGTGLPVPVSLAVDPDGASTGVAAHLMSRLPGDPIVSADHGVAVAMADVLGAIHAVRPAVPFRTYQSWAWPAKWVVPPWTRHPGAWRRAFDLLAADPPAYRPTFLHRDFQHRNLLWSGGAVSGIVDWVETSTGPAWLDAGHAATNLAVGFGPEPARDLLVAFAARSDEPLDAYWLVMDAVGFLPPPGRPPMFAEPDQLDRLDAWLTEVMAMVDGPA